MSGRGARVGPLSVPSPSNIQLTSMSHRNSHVSAIYINEPQMAQSEEDRVISRWVQENINKRVCARFTPKAKKDKNGMVKTERDPVCHCNYKKSKHSLNAQQSYREDKKDWNVTHDTEALSTDAFGEIQFVQYGSKVGKYIRVDHNTEMDTMLRLLTKYWKLELPSLLISVTGGAKNFNMRTRLNEVFRRGLMKAAESTGAWIITGGMHAGVMKYVGEAVRDYSIAHGNKTQVVAIGIAPYGCVNNKECLTYEHGGWPAEYRVDMNPASRKQAPLDHNHSHFILVDNGTQHEYAVEIPFRAKLESKISRLKTDAQDEESVTIPSVCVVLEGGPGTLETVKSAIMNRTPAVIVEGSGRAADILAYAYANSKEEEVEVSDKHGNIHKRVVPIVEDSVWQEVEKRILKEFGSDNVVQRLNWVKECLQKRDHMTVFRLDSNENTIDVAILHALLKVNRGKSTNQIKLALAWDRVDVAKSDIFTEDANWEAGDLDDVMYMAVMKNRVDFVRMFLENGVSPKDFLTKRRLLQLYNNIPKNCLLYQLLSKRKKKNEKFSLEDVGHLVQSLMGDFYRPLYLRDKRYKGLNVEQILCDLPSASNHLMEDDDLESRSEPLDKAVEADAFGTSLLISNDKQKKNMMGSNVMIMDVNGGKEPKADFDEPVRELFLWSVLMNRKDMAMLFWDEGKEGIAAALTAQKILKSLNQRTDDSELSKELQANTTFFENLAVGVLSECYAEDEIKAQLLLVRELPNFGNTTIVLLAVDADNKSFIAHAACQSLFNDIWMGKMSKDNGLIKMILAIVCPLLIFLFIKFRRDNREMLTTPDTKSKTQPSQMKREKTEFLHKDDGLPKDKKKNSSGYNPIMKVIHFYNAPCVTFICNCASYFLFLLLYAWILLSDFNPAIELKEIILIVWVFTLFAEEVRQVITDDGSSMYLKLRSYISDVWNILDVITMGFFIIGMILRFIPTSQCPQCFEIARIILALNLMTFFFRILHIFSVHKQLGPKLVMIGRMMIDLAYFMIILLVFIIAYGLAAQTILYPNTPISGNLITQVLYKPYWQMYGELFLDEITGDVPGCTRDPLLWGNGTAPRCPENDWFVPYLLAAYILITNILMINLLIAMFSYTFENVQDNTDLYWYFQRYYIIKDYYDRPPLAPPLILLSHVFLVARHFVRQCGVCEGKSVYRMTYTEGEEKQLILWENMNADEYIRKTSEAENMMIDNRVKETNERVDEISNKVDEIMESSFLTSNNAANQQPKLPPILEDRLNYLQAQLNRTNDALDWIIKSMVEKNAGSKSGPPQLEDIEKMREEAIRKKKEEEEKKKREFQVQLERQLELHVKSRTARYPCETCPNELVYRFDVPDEKVPWDVEWLQYGPTQFTDQKILNKPWFADVDLLSLPVKERKIRFNTLDGKIDRRSYIREYEVKDGIPLNPMGRTGLQGRGVLGRWGPNHAGDPIITRWKRDQDGSKVFDGGKPVLEFISIQRTDNKEWALPGGILDEHTGPVIGASQVVQSCMKAEFTQEALGLEEDERRSVRAQLDEVFLSGTEVYKGYADDHRNTDNAWIETIAFNCHDEHGHILKHFKLKAGDTVDMVRWQTLTSKQQLYGTHLQLLQKVATLQKAAF